MENNNIEKFDPSKLMDGVKDRIKATFVSLIPDDMWSSMVEKEIYMFTTGRIITERQYAGGGYVDVERREPYKMSSVPNDPKKDDDISPLQRMIRDELYARFKEDIIKTFDESEEYKGYWLAYGQPMIAEIVKKALVDNIETIFMNFMQGMIQYGFQGLRNQILNDLSNGYQKPW